MFNVQIQTLCILIIENAYFKLHFDSFCVFMCSCHSVYVSKVRGHLQELVRSFHPVCPKDGTQIVRLGCSCFYLSSHLSGLGFLNWIHFMTRNLIQEQSILFKNIYSVDSKDLTTLIPQQVLSKDY